MKKLSIILASSLLIGVAVQSCSSLNRSFGLKNDNPYEQILEDMIFISSGEKVDLSAEKELDSVIKDEVKDEK